jgi:hypothetical protein
MAKAGVRYKPNFSFQQNPIPKEKEKVAGRQGALIRTIARRSIRKRKAVSQPGSPPTDRGGLLKKWLFFSWDPTEQAVLVGPEKLAKSGRVPQLLEYGGAATIDGRRVEYRARPTMRLALEAAMDKLPELWGSAIK